jgi:DNA-binding NtrC family response regulator
MQCHPSASWILQTATRKRQEYSIMSDHKILIVDDDSLVRRATYDMLTRSGFVADMAEGGLQALELVGKNKYDVAIVDLVMPDIPGLETIRRIRSLSPDTETIVMTGHPSLDSSTEALREDISDYLCKPLEIGVLILSVRRAMERRQLKLENRELISQLEIERGRFQREAKAARRALEQHLVKDTTFIGESDAIRRLRHFITEVAPSDMTVLVRGESGTGKDVVAHLIHQSSGRSGQGSLVKINCPAIPETLLESELFGYEAGAFTGADRRKPGRLEMARNGTIFLDEIGEITPGLQVKLLEVIESKQFHRLGGKETINVDTRIISATNADLVKMISDGRYRQDLYYRLNEYCIVLPPLRDRVEDIPLLARHFLEMYGAKFKHSGLEVSPVAMKRMCEYEWPGNVREFEAMMRCFALTGREDTIVDSLEQSCLTPPSSVPKPTSDKLADREREAIRSALVQAKWNQRKAAELLGIGYSSLRRRITKYNLKDPENSS